MVIVSQMMPKLIKNSALFFTLCISLGLSSYSSESPQEMFNQEKQKISLRLSISPEQHTKGLSGLKAGSMKADEGMLFINKSMAPRKFWMPDTYFNLDIIFLDSQLKIVGIERNVPAHPGFTEPPVIYRTETYNAQYILETKAGIAFTKKLKLGDQLKWNGLRSF